MARGHETVADEGRALINKQNQEAMKEAARRARERQPAKLKGVGQFRKTEQEIRLEQKEPAKLKQTFTRSKSSDKAKEQAAENETPEQTAALNSTGNPFIKSGAVQTGTIDRLGAQLVDQATDGMNKGVAKLNQNSQRRAEARKEKKQEKMRSNAKAKTKDHAAER